MLMEVIVGKGGEMKATQNQTDFYLYETLPSLDTLKCALLLPEEGRACWVSQADFRHTSQEKG